MNCIIGICSNTNKIISNKRKLDTYYQYVKLKVNINQKTGSIRIFGSDTFRTSEMYCNGEKIKYDVIYNSYDSEIRINITSLRNGNEIVIYWNDKLFSTNKMFYNCTDIIEIDLSNFKTQSVTYMGHMFYGCSALTSLNLSNFNTQSVKYMGYMFYGCSALTSLNLSNFNTSSVKIMEYMFSGCSSLISLDLSNCYLNFLTFLNSNCNLKKIDISNCFFTNIINDIKYIINTCKSLH